AQNSGLFSGYALVNRLVRPTVLAAAASGVSCSPATIGWVGTQLIGDQNSKVAITGAANNAIHPMALSLAPSLLPLNVPGLFVNGCNLLVSTSAPDFYGLLSLQVGNIPKWTFPLPEFLPNNAQLYFQGFHTDGTSFEFYSTKRLLVTI